MEGGLAFGWHLSRGGATYGPYDWDSLVAWARDGRLGPNDLLWQERLPGWTPAWQVPGLFPGYDGASAAAYPRSATPRSPRLRWVVLSALAVLVVAGVVVGALAGAGVFSHETPVVETPMQGPTVIDVSYQSSEVVVSPEGGGRLEFQGAEVSVPSGAVDSDTTLEVKVLQDSFNISAEASPEDVAFAVGPVVDFGPAGTAFHKPVKISVPYDESLLPAGFDESRLALAYWDGLGWAQVEGAVDTGRNTVNVELKGFQGSATVVIAVILSTVATKMWWDKLSATDAIVEGKADQWITHKDPVVRKMAQGATLNGIPLTEKQNLATFLRQQDSRLEVAGNQGKPLSISFTRDDGTVVNLEGRYTQKNPGWNAPSKYFTTGDMRGDCTDVTNALVSVFRNLDYPAKAVFGYAGGAPHAWGEVVIEGQVYLIDEEGGLSGLQAGMVRNDLKRPTSSDSRNFMWDETGQKVLDPNWYTQFLSTPESTTSSTQVGTTATTTPSVPSGVDISGVWKGTYELTGDPATTFELTVIISRSGTLYRCQIDGGTADWPIDYDPSTRSISFNHPVYGALRFSGVLVDANTMSGTVYSYVWPEEKTPWTLKRQTP